MLKYQKPRTKETTLKNQNCSQLRQNDWLDADHASGVKLWILEHNCCDIREERYQMHIFDWCLAWMRAVVAVLKTRSKPVGFI